MATQSADPPPESEIWGTLTSVEETALHVSLYRFFGCSLPDGDTKLYDDSYDKAIVESCMPAEEQARRATNTSMHSLMAVRTLEIDQSLLGVTSGGVSQVVLLGSGLDTRAWRLHWTNPNVVMYEVDTGSLEYVKTKALAHFPLRCKRVFVQADLTKTEDLKRKLREAGLDPAKPVVWVLEGLVGYLSRRDSYSLFRALHQMSATGSSVIATCPPTKETKAESEAKGFKLSHKTYEAPSDTFARLRRAGWAANLKKADDLSAKWGLEARQSQMVGYKADLPLLPLLEWAGVAVAAALGVSVALAVRHRRAHN